MENCKSQKNNLRKEVNSRKSFYTIEDLKLMSAKIFAHIESSEVFQQSKDIFLYYSLSDEVQTIDFINKWRHNKRFYLPVVYKDTLVFRQLTDNQHFTISNYGVMEPVGKNYSNFTSQSLFIIPGMAFDLHKNRLGRGKGYYDRFLQLTSGIKMGVCFNFQLFTQIPIDSTDIKMDFVCTENGIIV